MESLYTKYRPTKFEEVVDQAHVVATLERAILEHRVGHAYLFCGPRGTGKTTMARLLAKSLLCSQGQGQLPDGSCEECQLIAAGEHPDVLEIDAASNTGVDNVRDAIIGRMNYAPVRGGYKVYIVDEVHMLTTAAFNALLKTLEEPPANVSFILCTTDPQKVPATILSRVQRFDFHAVSDEGIRSHLERVCAAEGFSFEPEALDLIVRHARGGMRDALTELEQVSVNERITLASVRDLHGEVSSATLAATARSLALRDVPALFEQVAGLVNDGRDLLQFVRELAGHIRDVYVIAALGTTEGVVNASETELVQLKAEADSFGSADRLARILSVLGDVSNTMRTAPNQRLELEIAFTKLARPTTDLTLESLAERVAELERERSAVSAAPVAVGAPAEVPTASVAVPAVEVAVPVAMPEPMAMPEPEVVPVESDVAPEEQAATEQPIAVPGSGPIQDQARLQRMWRSVVDAYMAINPAKGSILQTARLEADDGSSLTVSLPAGSPLSMRMLDQADARQALAPIVHEFIGPRTIVYVETNQPLETAPVASSIPEELPPLVPDPEPEPESVPVYVPAQEEPQTLNELIPEQVVDEPSSVEEVSSPDKHMPSNDLNSFETDGLANLVSQLEEQLGPSISVSFESSENHNQ